MDDGYTDDQTEALDLPGPSGPQSGMTGPHDDFDDAVPGGAGARRGPRQAAEGVRIIGAEEAAAAIEAGQVAGRRPGDAPRFGDVPEPPSGPRPTLRFPGADPTAVARPPVAEPPRPVAPRIPATGDQWSEPSYAGGSQAGSDVLPAEPDPYQGTADAGRHADPPMGMASGDDRGDPPEYDLAGPESYGGAEDPQFWGGPAESAHPADGGGGPRFGTYGGGGDEEGTGSTPLPHWTEPPSGEVARILPDAEPPADDDLRAWSSLSAGPRWRDQHTDWDEADFSDEMLGGPDLGLRADPSPEVAIDDEYGYAEEEPPAPARRSRGQGEPRGPSGPGRLAATLSSQPRDVTTSVITGLVALVVVLLAAAIGPKALVVLVVVALVIAAAELYGAMRVAGHHPATLLGVASTAALSGAVYWRGIDGFNLVMPIFVVFALLWYLTGVVKGRPLMSVSVTVFGFFYVGILGSYAVLLLTAPQNNGIGLLLGAVLTTAAYDAGAFFAGRAAGRTPLAPEISPGKTVEGMIGACAATLVAGIIVGQIAPWDLKRGIVLALVVMVVAPLGDLCESMLKRDLGVKDMGTILPGHGGVLDRIDALLFVVPATYYLVQVMNIS